MREALAWYVLIQVAGLAVWPLVGRALGPLADRGWGLTKAAGLLAVAWLSWFVCMLSPLPFTRLTLFGALLVWAVVGWGWQARRGRLGQELDWFGCHARRLLVLEALFLLSFGLFAVLRSHDPAIAITEKPMDMAFLNGFIAAQRLPTQDTWLSGYGVPYYYFGYFILACLAKLSGVPAGVAYNLAAACVPALASIGLASLAWSVARAARVAVPWAVAGAALAVVLVLFTGHLGTLVELLFAKGLVGADVGQLLGIKNFADGILPGAWPPANTFWWFHASRVIPNLEPDGIDEFPFFTALLADLHPHFVAWPWEILALGVAAAHLVSRGATLRSAWTQGLAGLSLGGLLVINTWDIAPFWTLYVALGVLAASRCGTWRGRWLAAVAAPIVGVALFAPYFVGYGGPPLGVGIVTDHTPLGSELVLFGWAVVLLAGLGLFVRWCQGDRWGWYLAAGAIVVGLGLGMIGQPTVGLLVALVGLLLPTPGQLGRIEPPIAFALGVGGLAALLLLGVELVFLNDVFHSRMNTVFKFDENAWLLAGLAAGLGLALLGEFTRRVRWLYAGCAVVAVAIGLVYPVSAIVTRLDQQPAGGPTLDGLSFLGADQLAAVQWMAGQNGAERAVIADGTFDEYNYQSGELATYSGAVTVLGWAGHELQWRGPLPELGIRQQDLANLYRDAPVSAVPSLLAKYGVQYVVVGDPERQKYGPAVSTRFDGTLPVAFHSGSITIYRVR